MIEINLTEGAEICNHEVKRIIINSLKDTYPVEDDIDLKLKIEFFRQENPHLEIEQIELWGPDDEGYENRAVLYVSEYPWYKETIDRNERIILRGKEYYVFFWPNAKGEMRVLDKAEKKLFYYNVNTKRFEGEKVKEMN